MTRASSPLFSLVQFALALVQQVWQCYVVVCHADGGVSQAFLQAMGPEIQKGTREKFQHISQVSLVQWVR